MSPEQLDPKRGHSFSADVWALGITIYNMLVGVPPFIGQNKQETMEKIFTSHIIYPKDCEIS